MSDREWGPSVRIAAAVANLLGRPDHTAEALRQARLAPARWPARHVLGRGVDPAAALIAARVRALCVGAAGAIVALAVGGTPMLPVAVAAVVGGGVAVDVALARSGRRAAAALLRDLPDAIELVAVVISAGRGLAAALQLVSVHTDGPLRALLARVDIAVGAGVGPAVALQVEAAASGVEGLSSLATTIERAQRLGRPLEASLLALADAARSEANVAALAHAARAVPAASVVTAMVVAPACIGAMAVVLLQSLPGSGGLG